MRKYIYLVLILLVVIPINIYAEQATDQGKAVVDKIMALQKHIDNSAIEKHDRILSEMKKIKTEIENGLSSSYGCYFSKLFNDLVISGIRVNLFEKYSDAVDLLIDCKDIPPTFFQSAAAQIARSKWEGLGENDWQLLLTKQISDMNKLKFFAITSENFINQQFSTYSMNVSNKYQVEALKLALENCPNLENCYHGLKLYRDFPESELNKLVRENVLSYLPLFKSENQINKTQECIKNSIGIDDALLFGATIE